MNIFHSGTKCTNRLCLIHGLRNAGNDLAKAGMEIHESTDKYMTERNPGYVCTDNRHGK
jgi:hypothetical protein